MASLFTIEAARQAPCRPHAGPAAPIATGSEGLATGWLAIASGTDRLPAYYARPSGGERLPTILVVQEVFGVHEHICDVCRRLAHLGYLAVAPELYYRQGDPRTLDGVEQILSEIVARVPDAQVMADLDACAAWAAANGGDPARLGITGFCWGGRIVWLYAAKRPQLRAGAAWYGRLTGGFHAAAGAQPIDLAGRLQVPVLGLYGGRDQRIPVADAEAMREALAAAGSRSEMLVYPEAEHAFFADYRPSYRRADAEDGWRRMREWFKQHGL